MGHSYTSCLMHVVFSTKARRREIDEELATRLWPYLGGLVRKNGVKALTVGGTEDHVHMLLSIPPTLSLAVTIQRIKGASSRWIHETFRDRQTFQWQEGYAAFSVGQSMIQRTRHYIETQAEHHRTSTFEEEFVAFLERHNIEYDPTYVFG